MKNLKTELDQRASRVICAPRIAPITGQEKVVTVIVAARDSALWLKECVESIRDQHLPTSWKAQILIGIDACLVTATTANAIKGGNVSVFYYPQWSGPYSIFNSLSIYARGTILCRFDADDIMLLGYMQRQLEFLQDDDTTAILRTWSIFTDEYLRPVSAPLSNGTFTAPDGTRRRGSDGQFMMRREVWERLGAFRPWLCFGDTEFLNRARFCGYRLKELAEFLYLRRTHVSSLTASASTCYNSPLRAYYQRINEQYYARFSDGWCPPTLVPSILKHYAL